MAEVMTDRELLELAAKAAGIKIDKSKFNGGGSGNTGFDLIGNVVLDWHNGRTWNPLTDDGDALRLAVKLHLDVNIGNGNTAVSWPIEMRHLGNGFFEPHKTDPDKATRRAIVRAAAEIGKGV